MATSEVHRTLVKSPPELWNELSDAAALGRHLADLGEIRITRLEPETVIEWETDSTRGRVRLAPSGWGTRVTLTATSVPGSDSPSNPDAAGPGSDLAAQAEATLVTPHDATPDRTAGSGRPLPLTAAGAARSADAEAASEAPEAGDPPAKDEPDDRPAEDEAAEDPFATLLAGATARRLAPDVRAGARIAGHPERDPGPTPGRRAGLVARLFGWRRRPAVPPMALQATAQGASGGGPQADGDAATEPAATEVPAPTAPEAGAPAPIPPEGLAWAGWTRATDGAADGPLETQLRSAASENDGPSESDLQDATRHLDDPPDGAADPGATRLDAGPATAGEPEGPQAPPDLAAELKAAEESGDTENVTAVLTKVLDRLGAAHHRPFSRA